MRCSRHQRRSGAALRGLAVAVVLPAGCFQEPVVILPDDDDQVGTSTTGVLTGATTVPADGSGTAAATSLATTDEPTATSLEGTATGPDDTSSTGETTTGAGGCVPRPPFTEIHWAADAQVVAPMELITAIFLPDMPLMARSLQANAGEVIFEFELPCDDTVMLHLLVWDAVEGPSPDNPDSYAVGFDGTDWTWPYGCKTVGLGDEHWAWQVLDEPPPGDPCMLSPGSFPLPAGTHALTLGNLEGGAGIDFAAIAAIIVTNDPALDPTSLYEPNP